MMFLFRLALLTLCLTAVSFSQDFSRALSLDSPNTTAVLSGSGLSLSGSASPCAGVVPNGGLDRMASEEQPAVSRNRLDAVLLRKDMVEPISFESSRIVPDSGAKEQIPPPFPGYSPNQTRIQWGRTAIIGSALALTIAAIHIYQQNAWWNDQRGPFHIVDDDTYALNVDKVGHFMGGATSSFVAQKSMEWCGFSRNSSVITGAILASLFELYIEFEDGFARDWGFSPGDAYADVIGAAWPVGQHFIPYLEHVQPKFSYWPSKALREGTSHRIMIDDYDGQTAWMGIHVHGLLPCSWQKYWPSWLGFAVGISVRGVDDPAGRPERNILIALDYDMTKIIPGGTWFLDTLAKALNYIHFPAPAIRISPGYIAYGLYF